MKSLKPKIVVCFLFLSSLLIGQYQMPSTTTGYVNFNMETSTLPTEYQTKGQGVTLMGCNTFISNADSTYWNQAPNGLKWECRDQVFHNLPYGYRIDSITNAPYFVSKYYIASPPVIKKEKQSKFDIGIVTPDNFVFKGNKPVQYVYMNYNILELTEIQYIPIIFDSSFDLWKVSKVPFTVECKNFPWLDQSNYNQAQGASGIGYLDKEVLQLKQLFLPYQSKKGFLSETEKYLDCKVTILNDILFHHEIYFKVDGVKTYSINLKDYFLNNNQKPITFYCDYRNELGCGCKEL